MHQRQIYCIWKCIVDGQSLKHPQGYPWPTVTFSTQNNRPSFMSKKHAVFILFFFHIFPIFNFVLHDFQISVFCFLVFHSCLWCPSTPLISTKAACHHSKSYIVYLHMKFDLCLFVVVEHSITEQTCCLQTFSQPAKNPNIIWPSIWDIRNQILLPQNEKSSRQQ